MEAARVVRDLDIPRNQIISLARNVDGHIKSGSGKRCPSDVNKLIDRFAHSSRMEDMQPISIEKTERGNDFRQIVGYNIALRHFAENLPTVRDVLDHNRWIDSLIGSSKEDRKSQIKRLLSTLTPSGSIGNVGASLMLDRTFSILSGEYSTVALGISEMFRTKSSNKNASIILAVMIHSSKKSEHHEAFAKYLNEKLCHYEIGKTIACICHDGKSAFSAYNTGEFLKNTILIRCDVHRLENLKATFSKGEADLQDRIIKKLFGKKEDTQKGTILRRGALNVLLLEEYEKKLDKISEICPSPAQTWLTKNKFDLLKTNSLVQKLRAGQTQQFFTTNLLESKKAALKLIIPHPIPAHVVLEKLSMLEDEIKNRIHAIQSLSSTLKSDEDLWT